MADPQHIDVEKEIEERFVSLPKVVQQAIVAADLSKRLRALASTHNLHVDQWQHLEDEVLLTMLGIQEIKTFKDDIQDGLGISSEQAVALTRDINAAVFEPIRQELGRQLGEPEAQKKAQTDVEKVRETVLAEAKTEGAEKPITTTVAAPIAPISAAPAVIPATPPAPASTEKAVRAPASSAYTSQAASHERKGVEGDPYREQIA